MIEDTGVTLYAVCDRCQNSIGILGHRNLEELEAQIQKMRWEYNPESGACRCPECND